MNYFRVSYLIIFVMALSLGCQKNPKKEHPSKPGKTPAVAKPVLFKEHTKWLDMVNSKSDSLQFLYTKDAVKVLTNGEVLKGNKEIGHYHLQNIVAPKSIKTDTLIMANVQRGLEYEIGEFTDQNNEKYKHLIIWKNEGSNRLRNFEFVLKATKTEQNFSELDQRRDLWMQLCNSHNAKNLITTLYSDNTIYYNHKPIVKGHDSLIPEYGYMNNESYKLSLEPIVVEQVNGEFVFEIGQCAGSYQGKYILIWQKDENGIWKIFIDSNI